MAKKKITLDYEPRPQQIEILDFVKDTFTVKNKKIAVIDAPTGTGKSYAAVMIADWYKKEVDKDAKFTILTNNKLLQDQYVKDFSFMSSLKGNNSYYCKTHKTSCGEAKVLNKIRKAPPCKMCPHTIAQKAFIKDDIGLTNYHLFNAYSLYTPDLLAERNASVLIIDEAHSFEEAFGDFISSTYSRYSLTNVGIWEDWMESDFSEIQNISAMAKYVESILMPKIVDKITDLLDEAKSTRGKKKKADLVKLADHADKSMCNWARFIDDSVNFEKNWVFEKQLDNDTGDIKILVEPIWGNMYLKELFWDKYDKIIMMSGTIVNPTIFSFLMGITEDDYEFLSLPCPFDVKKRPIIYTKFGKMTYYEKEKTFKTAVPIIKKILERNAENKGIIHTGNYQFSSWIRKSIKNKRLLFPDTKHRAKMLNQHMESEYPTVLVSPSMINGVDLKDELSRFQIIVKVPFPNLMSSKIKKRLDTYPDWYNWKTMITILQSYGRSIRNTDDWAETYILDASFDQILKGELPEYFREAIIIKYLYK